MNCFLQSYWREIAALVGFSVGLWRYLDSRARELKWRRTEFLFEQAKYLDNDEDIMSAVLIIAGESSTCTVEQIFGDNPDDTLKSQYIIGFEKLFNFLDRLAHAYFKLETLKEGEVNNFSWYLKEIEKSPELRVYCERSGFSDVVKLAGEV